MSFLFSEQNEMKSKNYKNTFADIWWSSSVTGSKFLENKQNIPCEGNKSNSWIIQAVKSASHASENRPHQAGSNLSPHSICGLESTNLLHEEHVFPPPY